MNWKGSYPNFPVLGKPANRLLTGLVICFPFYMWFYGWDYPVATALYLIIAGSIRFVTKSSKTFLPADWLMILVPVSLGLLVFAFGTRVGLYYPTAINLGFLLFFYSSLSTPVNFIQRIAEKIEKQPLDSIGIRYTRYVTGIWCLVFLVNATISAFLAWRQMIELWTIYNGIIAYFIIAFLLLGERLTRRMIQQKMRHTCNATGG